MNKLMFLSLRRLFLFVSIFFLLSSCDKMGGASKEDLEKDADKTELSDKENADIIEENEEKKIEELPPPSPKEVGYAYGVILAKAVQMNHLELDAGAVYGGLMDSLEKGEIETDEQEQILARAFKDGKRRYAAKNLVKQAEFLEKNKEEADVLCLESGLQYKVLKKGETSEKKAEKNSTVKVIYKGKVLGETSEFDSSNGEAVELSMESVIEGWREIIPLMDIGDNFEVFIPPMLGYGEDGINYRGQEIIPPNALLIFEIELVDIIEKEESEEDEQPKLRLK